MPAALSLAIWHDDKPDCAPAAVDAREEDAYWAHFYRLEQYVRTAYDYEDYAPAYCVGYIGFGQYGGSYGDAEKSLCANWERIKGDSRLVLDEAPLAIRAAWQRMEQADKRPAPWPGIAEENCAGVIRHRWGQAANQPQHQVS